VPTEDEAEADIILFNTCCIRDNAEKRAKGNIGAIKKYKKLNPNLLVVVMGCMTQQDKLGEELRKSFPFIDIVLGTNNIDKLGSLVTEYKSSRKPIVAIDKNDNPLINEDVPIYRTSGTNAWINIMYGCNNFCTYCIVPYVRGRERSRNPKDIIDEFKSMLDAGYKEITLLGQNVNSYGNDLGMKDGFTKLLEQIADISGEHRIRFMTSHPKDFSPSLIDVIAASPNICNNIHLPIQSGSDKILQLMNRHYTRSDYMKIIDNIRAKIPDCGITSDIMVGFPYEEEEDFLQTLEVVNEVKYSGAFTFVYSMRKGTPAASMPQISPEVAKDRIMRLVEMQNKITKQVSKTYEGKTYRVLCEDVAPKGNGFVCGRTDCGRMVTFEGDTSCIGKFFDVAIERSQSASLFGKVRDK
ncbi:MAG: tRNA (N6-isopentenyl adenosine(37)-C2)-methylthiotransferase MiaB, partial [Clostridia bacterium]|nr:tRNA (N6-isopentenyl adenosine(37)-C2)-methylthiotransferase MiaB [Clostridia bacterium]